MIQSTNLPKDMMASQERMISPASVEKMQTDMTLEKSSMDSSQDQAKDQSSSFSENSVAKAVEEMNKKLEGSEKKLAYSVHERTNRILIKVIDTKTDEVIKEVPDEKLMDMIADMCEASGLMVDEKI